MNQTFKNQTFKGNYTVTGKTEGEFFDICKDRLKNQVINFITKEIQNRGLNVNDYVFTEEKVLDEFNSVIDLFVQERKVGSKFTVTATAKQ